MMRLMKTGAKFVIKGTLSSGILFGGLIIVANPMLAATVTVGCAATDSCTLTELFNGGSIQVGQEILSNWSLVNSSITGTATSFDFNNIVVQEEDPIAFGHGVAYYANNQELSVFGAGTKSFSYNFKVTSLENDITEITSPLRYRSLNGFSPFLTGTIDVGTTQGSNNIGSATSIYSFSQVINGPPVAIPNLSSFWVDTSIDILSDYDVGFAQLGYLGGGSQGRAYQQLFQLAPVSSSVPEPSSVLGLLAFGTLGAGAVLKRKIKPSKSTGKELEKDS
jgi:hypothetical protein